jgi:hypothetical protein
MLYLGCATSAARPCASLAAPDIFKQIILYFISTPSAPVPKRSLRWVLGTVSQVQTRIPGRHQALQVFFKTYYKNGAVAGHFVLPEPYYPPQKHLKMGGLPCCELFSCYIFLLH